MRRPPVAAAMRACRPAVPAADHDGLRVPGSQALRRVQRQARLAALQPVELQPAALQRVVLLQERGPTELVQEPPMAPRAQPVPERPVAKTLSRPERCVAASHRARPAQQAVHSPGGPAVVRLMPAETLLAQRCLAEVPYVVQPRAVSRPEAAEAEQPSEPRRAAVAEARLSARQPEVVVAEEPSELRQAAVVTEARPWALPQEAGLPLARREVVGAAVQLSEPQAAVVARPWVPQPEGAVEEAARVAVRQPEVAATEVQPSAERVAEVEQPSAVPEAEAVQLSEVREAAVRPWAEPRPVADPWAAASACHPDQAQEPARPARGPWARCAAATR